MVCARLVEAASEGPRLSRDPALARGARNAEAVYVYALRLGHSRFDSFLHTSRLPLRPVMKDEC